MSDIMLARDNLNPQIQQLAEKIKAAQGDEAARLFLTGMIAHHKSAVKMAQEEVSNGRNLQAIALARQVIDDQQTEITEMEQILQQLPS